MARPIGPKRGEATADVTRPTWAPSTVTGAPRSREAGGEADAAHAAVGVAAVVQPGDRLLARVAPLREADRALLEAGLGGHRVGVELVAEPGQAGLDPGELPRIRRRRPVGRGRREQALDADGRRELGEGAVGVAPHERVVGRLERDLLAEARPQERPEHVVDGLRRAGEHQVVAGAEHLEVGDHARLRGEQERVRPAAGRDRLDVVRDHALQIGHGVRAARPHEPPLKHRCHAGQRTPIADHGRVTRALAASPTDVFCARLQALVDTDSPSCGTEQEGVAEQVAAWLTPAGATRTWVDEPDNPARSLVVTPARRRRPGGRPARPPRHGLRRRDDRAVAVRARRRPLHRPRRRRHEGRPRARGDGDRAAGSAAGAAVLGAAPAGVRRRGGAPARAGGRRSRPRRRRRARVRVRPPQRRSGLGPQGRALAHAAPARPRRPRRRRHRPRPQRRLGARARGAADRGPHRRPPRDDLGDHDGRGRRLRQHAPRHRPRDDRHPLERRRRPRAGGGRARAAEPLRRRLDGALRPRHVAADARRARICSRPRSATPATSASTSARSSPAASRTAAGRAPGASPRSTASARSAATTTPRPSGSRWRRSSSGSSSSCA